MTSNEEIMAKWYRDAREKTGQTIFQGSTIKDVHELMDLAREDERKSNKLKEQFEWSEGYDKGRADTKEKIIEQVKGFIRDASLSPYKPSISQLNILLKELEGKT